jgi:hypothetical protein
VFSVRFAKIMLKYILLLFNTKIFIPVSFDGSYASSVIFNSTSVLTEISASS